MISLKSIRERHTFNLAKVALPKINFSGFAEYLTINLIKMKVGLIYSELSIKQKIL